MTNHIFCNLNGEQLLCTLCPRQDDCLREVMDEWEDYGFDRHGEDPGNDECEE
jgi:hypothetical protein